MTFCFAGAIDVKPNDYPNSVNLVSNGVIPVAILTTDNFDATAVETARFGDALPDHYTFEDVDGDGDRDLILRFRTQQTNLIKAYKELLAEADQVLDSRLDKSVSNRQVATVSVTGKTVNDVFFEGYDDVELFLSGKALRELEKELAAAGKI